MIIEPGTLLFRGIDCTPDKVDPVLRVNGAEQILWVADDSIAAQTYIPRVPGRILLSLPWASDMDQSPRPDDGLVDALVTLLGGKFEVLRREHELPADHRDIPAYRITNGTWGRVTSWCTSVEITWREILQYLRSLGYGPDIDEHIGGRGAIWLNTQRKNGADQVLKKQHRMRGSLAILRVTQVLDGIDLSTGESDCLEPAYHKACAWTQKALEKQKDFIRIDDLAQTEFWGNVGHRSIAINPLGLPKLSVEAIIPAFHREWDQNWSQSPTIEVRGWRRGLIRNAA